MPTLTRNVLVSSAVFFVADSASQRIELYFRKASVQDTKEIGYSLARSLRYACVGGLVMAPLFHSWYKVSERFLPGQQAWYKKLVVETFTIAPVYLACNMAVATGLKTLRVFEASVGPDQESSCGAGVANEVRNKLSADYLRLYANALTVAPLYQAVNYRFVPPRYRMVWLNGCSLLFNMWVSFRVASST
mmetsp:Transcript_39083/g.72821  ORF Transcript_39083/g.72821 Transcript_39083/m.72821 type:complete len:190 (+) Transcript_39083:75-644(+)